MFDWLKGRGIWNNSKLDPPEIYDAESKLIDMKINKNSFLNFA